jgi:uncharacterized protein YbcC (UPF0753/DUF2309 family)
VTSPSDSVSTVRRAGPADPRRQRLHEAVHHASHLVPSQGPISIFVHHNTLHALEDQTFDQALEHSIEVYGCQPYMSESYYRAQYASGRIRDVELSQALQEDLGDRADELIGFLGTRYHFRLMMLKFSLQTATAAELRWVIAETEALRRFRNDAPADVRKRMIEETRRWVMREHRRGGAEESLQADAVVSEIAAKISDAPRELWSEALWESLTLQLLWRFSVAGVQDQRPATCRGARELRPRDWLVASCETDPDRLVHDLLIRFLPAFCDQGMAPWPLPGREHGLRRSFLELYAGCDGMLPSWLARGRSLLEAELEVVDPLASIENSLEAMGVAPEDADSLIAETALALRGWAGMIWQLEFNGDGAVRKLPAGSFEEFLALRLLLDRIAATYVAEKELGETGPLSALAHRKKSEATLHEGDRGMQRAFTVFQLAQTLGWSPESLSVLPPEAWKRLTEEVESFGDVARRKVFHRAFELGYRNSALDALASRSRQAAEVAARKPADPAFQILCCIDDREESFRRHLEEIQPQCETFGYAGFFGVAMYYRGLADAHLRPLCPVVVKPRHYVEESPGYSFQQTSERRAKTRRVLGAASHRFHRGSHSLLGGAVTALVGSLASVPLVMRILFPRLTAELRRMFGQIVRPPQVTQLMLERSEPEPGPGEGHLGYTVAEMAEIVERTLRDVGLSSDFAKLVFVCGHGSSSLNNPHESAYNCGACSGGRGGPNARAFSQMANDARVRQRLDERGLRIPPETYFVGAYHNTCDDNVEYYDLDRLPTRLQGAFRSAKAAIDEARRRNAHERCRRFESVGLDISVEGALRHVEERSEDLSQARPEYNHATNAMCLVGRRALSRGLYLDRRSFLASYDPEQDDAEGTILGRILQAVIPVCAGISLEYYFSCVDVAGYGCGSKLPHNITSLLGVMEGAASDLRTGLSAQMTEIHEPMRILFVIETQPAVMQGVIARSEVIGRLCRNQWVQLAVIDSGTGALAVWNGESFAPYAVSAPELPEAISSHDWYRGWRGNLPPAKVVGSPFAALATASSEDVLR